MPLPHISFVRRYFKMKRGPGPNQKPDGVFFIWQEMPDAVTFIALTDIQRIDIRPLDDHTPGKAVDMCIYTKTDEIIWPLWAAFGTYRDLQEFAMTETRTVDTQERS